MLIINSSSQAVGVARPDINRPTTQKNKEEKNRGKLSLVKEKCESTENVLLGVKRLLLAHMKTHIGNAVTDPVTYIYTKEINSETSCVLL